MSRHRNIRKLNIEEELEEDDDADYYGRSLEEDSPLSPESSRFMYNRRPNLTYVINEDINEEDYNSGVSSDAKNNIAEEVFSLEEGLSSTKAQAKNINDKGFKPNKKFVLGEPKWKSSPIQAAVLSPSIESLRISESKPSRANSKSPSRMTPNSSFHRLSAIDVALASVSTYKQRTRPTDALRSVNLVIVGHVDAGKSTLVGHLLYLLGNVNDKIMHKNRQESARAGKSSFAFAWILDEGDEERKRGVTMDIARVSFHSKKRLYHILDAPGHKDFIPNMITGASQADAALLVINATRGEFETGFDQGGQTREHALLLRSLGVSKVIAAINKLDTIEWSHERFEEVSSSLRTFLQKQAGFEDIQFVPVSGLTGINLIEHPHVDHPLSVWYNGSTLLEALDNLPEPNHLENQFLRIVVNDVIKLTVNMAVLSCKVETGSVESGDKLFLMPEANSVIVKFVLDDVSDIAKQSLQQQQQMQSVGFAGDQILLSAAGSFEPDSIHSGHVLCRGGPTELLVPIKKFSARIVVFDIRIPILKGTRAELFAHSLRVSCIIAKLKSIIHKTTRQTIKENPRVLTKNMTSLVEIETELPVNIEPYPKILCRFTLRANNQTIAAGIVDEAL